MSGPAREWWVFVHAPGVGYIGTVTEDTEENARCAALAKYSAEGERAKLLHRHARPQNMAIFEDDDFDVRKV